MRVAVPLNSAVFSSFETLCVQVGKQELGPSFRQ